MALPLDRRRIADLLYFKIRQSGFKMRDVSRAMGLSPDQVSRLLKGQLLLRLEHIYEMLEILGVPPATFWAELEGLPDAALARRYALGHSRDPDEVLLAGITRGELMEEVRRVVREELERRVSDVGRPRPLRPQRATGARRRPSAAVKKSKNS